MVNGQLGMLGLPALHIVGREPENEIEHAPGLTTHNMACTVREVQSKQRVVTHRIVQVMNMYIAIYQTAWIVPTG